MAYWDAAAVVASSLVGDQMASSASGAANQMTENIAQQNNRFNANQAATARSFDAQQAGIARRYDTEMSDTAMQRRVQDLQKAGLNPSMAMMGGGASAPVVSGANGPSASSSGNPNIQNTGAAFGNLGSQVSSALSLNTQKAQVDLLQAQATKTNEEAGVEIPAQVENIKSSTGLNVARANEAWKNVQVISTALEPINSSDQSNAAVQQRSQAQLAQLKVSIAQMSPEARQDTMDVVNKAVKDEAFARQIGAENIFNADSSVVGQIGAYFKAALPISSSAISAANALPPE